MRAFKRSGHVGGAWHDKPCAYLPALPRCFASSWPGGSFSGLSVSCYLAEPHRLDRTAVACRKLLSNVFFYAPSGFGLVVGTETTDHRPPLATTRALRARISWKRGSAAGAGAWQCLMSDLRGKRRGRGRRDSEYHGPWRRLQQQELPREEGAEEGKRKWRKLKPTQE